MQQFYLTEITTKDGIFLEGVWYVPPKSRKRALLWVHGLTSSFYGNIPLLNTLAAVCEAEGWGLAAFNNRGHDLIASLSKLDKRKKKGYRHVNGGAGYEHFKESIFDIDAGVNFLKAQGFTEVVVIGHSTGALKACYYAATTKNPAFFAVVLSGPASDRLDTSLNPKKRSEDIIRMERLIKIGKGDELLFGYHFFPLTPKRFLSLYKPNTLEDQFDYGDKSPRLMYFKHIKKPTLVVFGEADEYLDRPAEKIIAVLKKHQRSQNLTTGIIAGAFHSFNGKENEFVTEIKNWIKTL